MPKPLASTWPAWVQELDGMMPGLPMDATIWSIEGLREGNWVKAIHPSEQKREKEGAEGTAQQDSVMEVEE